jgi:hypothetical protein
MTATRAAGPRRFAGALAGPRRFAGALAGPRRFAGALAGIAGAALVVRFVNVLVLRPGDRGCTSFDGCFAVNGDALYSHLQGELLAQGHGFASSFSFWFFGTVQPGAGDPPLYALFLGWISAMHGSGGLGPQLLGLAMAAAVVAGVWWVTRRRGVAWPVGVAALAMAALVAVAVVPAIGADQVGVERPGTTATAEPVTLPDGVTVVVEAVEDPGAVLAHRLASSLLGVGGVVLIGLATRRLAGDRAGLVAAGLAALHPLLWINDGMLLSEALVAPMVALVVLAAYRLWDHPGLGTAALFGAAVALAGLNRPESLLLGPLIVLPMAWGQRHLAGGGRAALARVAVAGATCVALLLPWLGHNLARFEEPTFMTSGTGAVLSAGSCDVAYHGEFAGYYGANCFAQYVEQGWVEWPDAAAEESVRDVPAREGALRYIRENRRDLPRVALLRMGRMWLVYQPTQNVLLEYQVEGRGRLASWAGLFFYAALVPPAAGGLWVLRRRRVPISPLVAPAVAVSLTAAATFGIIRYRVPADATMLMAAGVGIDAVLRRRWPLGRPPESGAPTTSSAPTGAAPP